MKNELISPTFRIEFREFCVASLVLRQINDFFINAGIVKKSTDKFYSGQRRTLVEEYYASLDWAKEQDAQKFLTVIELVLAQSYLQIDDKKKLINLLETEGFKFENRRIYKQSTTPLKNLIVDETKLRQLQQKLIDMTQDKQSQQQRGYAFEIFLNELFDLFNLLPKPSFRLTGEQIDGSFQHDGATYLLEAKWHSQPIYQGDLLIFRGKVESKATWSRGLFVSYSGFSRDGLEALSKGKATNIIGIDGQDLYYVVSGKISLTECITLKSRYAAETGEFFIPIIELIN